MIFKRYFIWYLFLEKPNFVFSKWQREFYVYRY